MSWGRFLSSLRDLAFSGGCGYPALKRWAIFRGAIHVCRNTGLLFASFPSWSLGTSAVPSKNPLR